MNQSLCQSLDDYLAHDLTGDELVRFSAHLPDCPDCRQVIREHQRLATLLVEATDRLEPVPAGLTERVGRRLRAARRRRVAAVAATLAATVAVAWLVVRAAPRPDEPTPPRAEVRPKPSPTDAPQQAQRVRVTFPGDSMLAVPAKIESPNVTFVWIYPGLRASPALAPAADSPLSPLERSDQ
jgi:hypothetical protein